MQKNSQSMIIEFFDIMFDKLKANEFNICVDFVIFITKKSVGCFLVGQICLKKC